ncbi:hypothetical protein LOTGIDRAFT_237189 [Lottia gigantea]|uniref:Uncharacterized protein n=1 Tax=Lottia gigantea TaxID=225164 RepID=V3ZI48_LOTGI|nr:hypothetical protein LOTGIDRAFT_237189 [Lottia gigantea]ESO81990.1 hypothetical protein LOTGIDRAFT_237189 [Lottia gigantea]
MASDDEDEELKALRLAVLLSMKKKVDKELSPPKPKKNNSSDLEALRHAALANIESAGVKPIVPQPIPTSNSPLYKSQSFPKVVHNNFKNVASGQPRSRPRASNLIVINPEPQDVPQKPVISEKKSVDKPVLLRPQDKWCSPTTGTSVSQVVEESKPKVPSKFSRYDSSDSESSDASSSDSESEEEKPLPSPKQNSDSEDEKPVSPKSKSNAKSEKKGSSSDISSDSDSDDIEKQIDNILNSPEIKDKKTDISDNTHEKVLKTKTLEKSVTKIIDKSTSTLSKTEIPKTEAKSIPTLIGGSKSGVRKKVSNAWSDSESDSGIRSGKERQKLKKNKSWSDQGSSDEENKPVKNANNAKSQVPPVVEPMPQKSKAEIQKEKEDRRRMIENDLQKTLKDLQSIKEKRRKQEASQKGSKDTKSPDSKHRKRSSSISPRRRSISPRRRSPFERRRSSSRSPRRRRSFSPRRTRSRSFSRSPSGKKRSPSPGLKKRRSPGSRRSPDPRRRKRSPLGFKGAYHRRSPQSKRSPKNNLSGNSSLDPRKEKRVLSSEERRKIEARRRKFESSAIEVKKTISLKNIVRKSNSRERSPSPKSPKDRAKKLPDPTEESSSKKRLTEVENKVSNSESRRKSKELKENNDNEDSDASKGSVSSLSDSDSDKEESRSWRKEQNNTKHLNKRKQTDVRDRLDRPGFDRHKHERPRFVRSEGDRQGFERSQRDQQGFDRSKRDQQGFDRSKRDQQGFDRSKKDQQGFDRSKKDQQGFDRSRGGLDRPRTRDRPGSPPSRSRKDKEAIKDDPGNETKSVANDMESKVLPKKIYRTDSHVFSDNVDRGFDASNYRKTKIDSGVASGGSDSEGDAKDKKLISVVLSSDSKQNSPAPIITSPIRKVECSETVPEKSHRKHHKHRSERHKSKRVVITDMDEMPRKKKLKTERLGDARDLLEAIKGQNDNSRRAVIRNDGISVTLEDQEPDSPRKPSVHERLGRKVPSLMSIKTEDLRRGRSPEPEPKVLNLTTKESKRSKDKSSRKLERRDSFEKKSKKKRSIIHYDSPEEDGNDDNLEKRIQIIKEKNAAILKRQAEIQKDKEIFG